MTLSSIQLLGSISEAIGNVEDTFITQKVHSDPKW